MVKCARGERALRDLNDSQLSTHQQVVQTVAVYAEGVSWQYVDWLYFQISKGNAVHQTIWLPELTDVINLLSKHFLKLEILLLPYPSHFRAILGQTLRAGTCGHHKFCPVHR